MKISLNLLILQDMSVFKKELSITTLKRVQ